MMLVKLSTAQALPILMVDATDGYTPEAGLTLTVTIRKAGGSWAAAGGSTPTDRTVGSYEYTPTTGELNTLGLFEYRAVGSGARDFRGAVQVVAELPGQLAAGAITAAVVATDAIDADAIAADAVTEIQSGLAVAATVAAAIAAVQADTDNLQTRVPAALVSGRMDVSVGAMAAGVVTAAAIATDAIDADALAADAVAEIQSGLATAAALATVQADTDNIQTRIPAALVGGRMDASVGAVAAGAITAAAIATGAIDADALASDAVTEIQAGLATATDIAGVLSAVAGVNADTDALQLDAATIIVGVASVASAVAAVQADTDNLQTRVPAALVSGRMDASVGAMAANVVTAASVATGAIDADALAADAATEIAAAVDATLTTAHGSGSWASGPTFFLDDNIVRNGSNLPTSARRRFFATAADRDAATAGGGLTGEETEVVTVSWAYSGALVTSQRGAV